MSCLVVRQKVIDVPEVLNTSIIRHIIDMLMEAVPVNSTRLHGATSSKTVIILAAVRT
jgi:hypothetical protein